MSASRAGLALAALLVTAAFQAQPAPADGTVELRSGRQLVRIALVGALPVEWSSCAESCDEAGDPMQRIVAPGDGAVRWHADRAADATAMSRLSYTAELTESASAVTAVLTSAASADSPALVQRYALSRADHGLHMELQALPGVGLQMATGRAFVPEPLPGFGSAFSDVEAVQVSGDGQEEVEPDERQIGETAVRRDAWLGIRARFWAWLARPAVETSAVVSMTAANQPEVTWRAPAGRLDLTVYAGPVEWKSLRVVSPDLTQMLFASLWEPLRWLCYGLLFLLGFIGRWIGVAGVAIIVLSLAVKIILAPLTAIAERWQQDVNRTQGRIQPQIAAIRRQYRGEEAHERTLQVYRAEGVHPLFTLKSLAGFAIQVPMFIAAFDMLADNFALSGARFLWIDDLAAPDRFMALPFALPFFGADLNLLPFVMTLLTVLSAFTQRDASLTPELLQKQQRQLYLMAGGFFLLFYTFPAGMVLYWTANNFWHFAKVQLLSGRSQRRS